MKILHFTLGLPPYRSGGLTKYATDLMTAQKNNGDTVSLLYPGDFTFWKIPKMKIRKDVIYENITVYELLNPPMVPLQYGVSNPNDIMQPRYSLSKFEIELFYESIKPEIFHIHTWMGLPENLIKYLKEKGVKIIFTSHDYYGLCVKTNFINQDDLFCFSNGGEQCAKCNKNAPSTFFLKLRNSKYLLRFKDILSFGNSKPNNSFKKKSKPLIIGYNEINKYSEFINYSLGLFKYIDCVHYNSNTSKEVYQKYLINKTFKVIPISAYSIRDARIIKSFDKKHIKIAFVGNLTTYKGFPILKNVLLKLYNSNIQNWTLQVWWGGNLGIDPECDNIIYKGKYSAENLKNIYNDIDLLIVPSVWKETFSLITLEAISCGVPVLVSNNVGAKDVVNYYDSNFVIELSEESLFIKLREILSNDILLEDFNRKICISNFKFGFDNHCVEMNQLYRNILDEHN